MPLLLLIPIAMYGVLRLWLRLRGQTWKPEGKWVARTAGTDAYMASQREKMTRSDKVTIAITVIGTLSVAALFVLLVTTSR